MSSTTPVPERAPRGAGAGEPARRAPGEPMRALLASCAAAEAVSTPPRRRTAAVTTDAAEAPEPADPSDAVVRADTGAHHTRRAAA
ncbi:MULTISPECIES: hypothetical protein [unclassified Streptomyces]|uniref:hypothetical protein n=1 Tax=Streptomycetaceae TaxID=2062 RepID=UPI002E77751F|nr:MULTISPECIES: hypothetical protein [unclassified Streptomyces]MED7951805.1 hypothetical protein [Streptomyces sp. BE303]MEE1828861.1 hypothetical protein [Streptomyces sp. BE20]